MPERVATAVILAVPCLIAAFGVACSSRDRFPPATELICQPDTVGCDGDTAGTCNSAGTAWEDTVLCEGRTPVCVHGLGCVVCVPGARRCQGNAVLLCTELGEEWVQDEVCDGETFCFEGNCGRDCARAGVFRSYIGCDYSAVTLMNTELSSDFLPALVIGNGNSEAAHVTVTRGTRWAEEVTVPPDSTATLELPWDTDLKDGNALGMSVNTDSAAYRVVSSLPVTVYQFNPLNYALNHDCSNNDTSPGDGVCYSYSNDASLLLPTPALTRHYMVMSRPNLGIRFDFVGESETRYHFSPAVVAVVNPHDTEVTVDVLPSAPIDSGRGVSALEAGELGTFTISPGGVLQLAVRSPDHCVPDWLESEAVPCAGTLECVFGYCNLVDLDLTGTEIIASEPVAVFAAHDCDFIPYNRWACDHLEEQVFPYETWGRQFVASQSHRENDEPDLWRILSGIDGNTIRFDPDTVHDEVVLDRGEHLELEAAGAFVIEADGPTLVGQFLVGQNYNFVPVEQEMPPGDPAFALVVPIEQWRNSYNFLAPDTYDRSFLNITASKDHFTAIILDGAGLATEPWEMIGDTNYVTLRHEIEPGTHVIRSTDEEPFGILVYGFGQYTSYMYPGGLDLEPISVW